MGKVKLQKWGNSLGVRIPKSITEDLNVGEGSELEISVLEGNIIFKPAFIVSYSLDELLSQVKKCHIPKGDDWGKPRGEEIW